MGLNIISDSETKSYEEKFLIYTMFSKPSDYIWISYALSDNEGKSIRPSILIDRIKTIFPSLNHESDILVNEELMLKYISRPIATFKYLVEYIRKFSEGNEINQFWFDVYNWYFNNIEWKDKLSYSVEGIFHDNLIHYIDEKLARNLYNIPFKSSISRLESFINCPFSHFIKYGLKPEERKEFKIKIPDVGMLFHTAVENYSKKIQKENIDWNSIVKEQSDNYVESIIDEIVPEFQNNVLSSTHRYMYLVKKLKRISKRAAWTLAEHLKNGEFTPLYHEFGFGDGPNYQAPPIIIELPNGEKIILEGRIDRIDLLNTEDGKYIKVILKLWNNLIYNTFYIIITLLLYYAIPINIFLLNFF